MKNLRTTVFPTGHAARRMTAVRIFAFFACAYLAACEHANDEEPFVGGPSSCSSCDQMVVIEGGTFLMGAPEDEPGHDPDEVPRHEVSVPAFAIGKYEVTRGEFSEFVRETGHEAGDSCSADLDGDGSWRPTEGLNWTNPGFEQSDLDPVVCVSWEDAVAYARWLSVRTSRSFRLPTEAEWELAARANTDSARFWQPADGDMCDFANGADISAGAAGTALNTSDCDDGFANTAPVGSFQANGFGLYDVLGNVWELLSDCYHPGFEGAPTDGSAWVGRCPDNERIGKGSAWNAAPRSLRSANRSGTDQGDRRNYIGFRLAMSVSDLPPDAVYYNARVITLSDSSDIATAMAVKGDRFLAVGDQADLLGMAGPDTATFDLGGATVVPGFVDAHDHLWNSAKWQFRGIDMIGVTTWDQMRERLENALAKVEPGETIFTTLGWRGIRPFPTRAQLDELAPENPVVLIRSRQGKGLVNTAALRTLGLDRSNPVFNGFELPVDADGQPTGEPPPYPGSLQFMTALTPALTPETEASVFRQAMAARNALGITSTRELSIWPDGVEAFKRYRATGDMTLRVALGVEYPVQEETADYLATLPAVNRDDPFLFVDAASEEPWPPGSASPEVFTEFVRKVRSLGLRTAPHVSSDDARGISYDEATDAALAAYEVLDAERPLRPERWYMEHVPFATPADMERMAALGIIVSVQEAGYDPEQPAPLSPDRMAHENPVRSYIDHGVVVIGGSDFTSPTALEAHPNDPMIRYFFFVSRRTRDGEILTPQEVVSREEALRIMTVNPAYATFQDLTKGRILPEMYADFVILNQDLLSVEEDRILETRPLATVVGGRPVYTADGYSLEDSSIR